MPDNAKFTGRIARRESYTFTQFYMSYHTQLTKIDEVEYRTITLEPNSSVKHVDLVRDNIKRNIVQQHQQQFIFYPDPCLTEMIRIKGSYKFKHVTRCHCFGVVYQLPYYDVNLQATAFALLETNDAS